MQGPDAKAIGQHLVPLVRALPPVYSPSDSRANWKNKEEVQECWSFLLNEFGCLSQKAFYKARAQYFSNHGSETTSRDLVSRYDLNYDDFRAYFLIWLGRPGHKKSSRVAGSPRLISRIYNYWLDNNQSEEAFQTAWYQQSFYAACDFFREHGFRGGIPEGTDFIRTKDAPQVVSLEQFRAAQESQASENSAPEEDALEEGIHCERCISLSPASVYDSITPQQLKTLCQFLQNLNEQSDDYRHKCAAYCIYYYPILFNIEQIAPLISEVVSYCASLHDFQEEDVRQQLVQQMSRQTADAKKRRNHKRTNFPYEFVAGLLKEESSHRGDYPTLASWIRRINFQLRALTKKGDGI